MKSLVLALALLGLATGAQAGDPSVTGLTPGYSFSEYTGTAPVGNGSVDVNSALFYIDEQTVGGLKSWYIFFDPKRGQEVEATIHFDAPIQSVLTTRSALDSTNAVYGIDVDGDGAADDYGSSVFIGLEPDNQALWSVGGNSLYIKWSALDPGDHIRVLTAVPEPSTYALLIAGLFMIGVTTLRRGRTS